MSRQSMRRAESSPLSRRSRTIPRSRSRAGKFSASSLWSRPSALRKPIRLARRAARLTQRRTSFRAAHKTAATQVQAARDALLFLSGEVHGPVEAVERRILDWIIIHSTEPPFLWCPVSETYFPIKTQSERRNQQALLTATRTSGGFMCRCQIKDAGQQRSHPSAAVRRTT